MTNTELLSRVVALRDCRRTAAERAAELAAKREAFDRENAVLIQTTKLAQDAVAAAETSVRAVAGEVYATTQDAKLCAGVTVKLFDVLSYDAAKAFEWAKQTNMALVPESLDKKAFEKIAKATTLPFVAIEKEPRVTIATDLDAALFTVEQPVAAGAN